MRSPRAAQFTPNRYQKSSANVHPLPQVLASGVPRSALNRSVPGKRVASGMHAKIGMQRLKIFTEAVEASPSAERRASLSLNRKQQAARLTCDVPAFNLLSASAHSARPAEDARQL